MEILNLYTQWMNTPIEIKLATRYEVYKEALKHAKEDNNHELEAQLMAAILGFGLNADSK